MTRADEASSPGAAAADDDLVARARAARTHAHAPYSGFHVGAALRAANGQVFTGVNVESAASPAGLCAERAALAAAVSAGARALVVLAVAGDGAEPCVPCGLCRQALHELAPDLVVLAAGEAGGAARHLLRDLLPQPFERPRGALG